jgi:predicted transcriptional regulator
VRGGINFARDVHLSHVLEQVEAVTDRVEITDDGQMVAVDSIDGLRHQLDAGTKLGLLEAIIEQEPESIRELARVVDRISAEILENVNELADYGLVELEENGRAKQPVV